MKFVIGFLLVIGLVLWGSWELVDWAFEHDMRRAEQICARTGATPDYTHDTHGVCITSDGRITGTF